MFNLFVVSVFCTVLFYVSAKEEVYSNSWAVEVRGGHHVADALAKKHGFINKGQVSYQARVRSKVKGIYGLVSVSLVVYV